MRALDSLRQRLRALLHQRRVEDELEAELRFHIERQIEENIAGGMSPGQARRAAVHQFGCSEAIKEECRDARGWARLAGDFAQDTRYAARCLRKAPAFTFAAILTLTLGIGANSAMFTLVDAALLRMLPVHDPERLVVLSRANAERGGLTSFPYPFYRELRDGTGTVFDGVICRAGMSPSLAAGGSAELVTGELVSGNFFQVLGVQPYLGRLFTRDDDRSPGAHPVVVLSHGFWRSRFAADPQVIGRTIRLNTHPMTVIGVTPPAFKGLDLGRAPDVRVPIMMQREMHGGTYLQIEQRGDWWLHIFARLRPGVTPRQAAAAATPLMLGYLGSYDSHDRSSEYQKRLAASNRIELRGAAQGMRRTRRDGGRDPFEIALLVLLAMTTTVLVIACVSIANLLLARASARGHEIAIRVALGAGRGRLLRQSLTESLMLAAAGGAAGVALAPLGAGAMVRMFFKPETAAAIDVSPDARVLAFTATASILTGVAFGLAPWLGSLRRSFGGTLGSAQRQTAARQAGRGALAAVQVAFSVMLLAGAGLFVRTLVNLRTLDTGFERQNLIMMGVDPSLSGYPPGRMAQFHREILGRIKELPGVRAAAEAAMPLVSSSSWGSGIKIEGYTPKENDRGPERNVVSPGYFSAIGMPIVLGREFSERDDAAGPKVAIVNQTFAKFYFGDANPLGRRIGPGGDRTPEYTIVGVAKDGKYADIREEQQRFWYIPCEQLPKFRGSMTLHVRTVGAPEPLIAAIRREIAAAGRDVPVFNVRTLEMQVNEQLAKERVLATLAVFFGGLAALLAAIGLYGVLAYAVSRRTREIGVRMALGASPPKVIAMVMGQTAAMTLAGTAAGLAGALALSRYTESLLFGVTTRDTAAFAGAALLMIAVAALAAYLPARRAAAVDPARALRAE